MLSQENKELCSLFAEVLDYPGRRLPQSSELLALQLAAAYPGIASQVRSFAYFVKNQSLENLEELYTQTFDISPATSLYLGYHLFGETPKRSEFLIRLTDAYQSKSFSSGIELADHLGIVLRFLSVSPERSFALPLLEECVLPVLTKTGKELKKTDNPYALVISPLQDLLTQITQRLAKAGGVSNA